MENLVLVVHLLAALAIIGLILLQQGKGADMGASFGAGASQTLFGAAGSGNFFSRMTAIFATVFFVTSFTLAVLAKQSTEVDDIPLPALQEVQDDEIPAIDDVDSDIPVVDAVEEAAIPAVEEAEATLDEGMVIEEAGEEELPEAPVE